MGASGRKLPVCIQHYSQQWLQLQVMTCGNTVATTTQTLHDCDCDMRVRGSRGGTSRMTGVDRLQSRGRWGRMGGMGGMGA